MTTEQASEIDAAFFVASTKMATRELHALLSEDQCRALPWIKAAAACGLAAAQVRLGRILLEGRDCGKDEPAAFGWFNRAAAGNDPDAQNMVGRCFENGWGVRADAVQAVLWYGRAAEAGHDWAQYNLGHMYLDGNGVAQDRAVAFQWYRRAAEQGHVRAMNLLARCYEEGWGVDMDANAARVWYSRSAEGGYFRGQYNFASLLVREGRMADAFAWFERAMTDATPETRRNMAKGLAAAPHPRLRAMGLELLGVAANPAEPINS